MTPWWTEERVARLRQAVERWIGTPFSSNGTTCGPAGGVSCQKLAASLHSECGFPVPPVPDISRMGHGSQGHRESLVMAWFDQHPQFVRVGRDDVRPGDLLGFRIGRVVHHLGVYLGAGRFVSAMYRLGVSRNSLSDPTWGRRLAAVWRAME